MDKLNRKETTKFLSHLVKRRCCSSEYASEVTVDVNSSNVKRVDFMEFKPEQSIFLSGIEKGIFICYEVKSCIHDIYSGNGLNFLGEKNYLVMTMDCYKEFLPDFNSGKFFDYLHDNYPESSSYVGIQVALPKETFLVNEFENPTELPSNEDEWDDWKLVSAIRCLSGPRRKSTTELLYCMLRSGR